MFFEKIKITQTLNSESFCTSREDNVDISFEDAQSQVRKIKKRLVPVAVWKCGKKFDIKELTPCPNQSKVCAQVKFWDELVIRDDTRPTPEIK